MFYADEWINRRDENNPTGTVPTLAMRNGDLSELLNPANPFLQGSSRSARSADRPAFPG